MWEVGGRLTGQHTVGGTVGVPRGLMGSGRQGEDPALMPDLKSIPEQPGLLNFSGADPISPIWTSVALLKLRGNDPP